MLSTFSNDGMGHQSGVRIKVPSGFEITFMFSGSVINVSSMAELIFNQGSENGA